MPRLVQSFLFHCSKDQFIRGVYVLSWVWDKQPHPAIGESNSGMPRNIHASFQPKSAALDDHLLAGCRLAEILLPIEAGSFLS
jgi:hypothetical protein